MAISPEMQAKIDALEDENLRERVVAALTSTGKKLATDEEIFDLITESFLEAKAQQARLKVWQHHEVEAFAHYFKEKDPEGYAEFVRQEREFNQIDRLLGWSVYKLIWQWGVSSADSRGLLGRLRDHVRSATGRQPRGQVSRSRRILRFRRGADIY